MQFDDIIKSHPLVLVDFFADWCGPCKMLAPVLKEVKTQLSDRIKIVKIDVDKHPNLAARFNIRSMPTMVLFKNSTETRRIIGAVQTHELHQILSHYVN